MKTLHTIQSICTIGKVVSKIVFVCCIVGFCLCIVGVVSLAVGLPVIKLGGVTLENIVQNKAGLSTGTLYASMTAGAIICAGEALLAKFAARYFKQELADGNPFTQDGAHALMRLGVLSIVIPLGMQIAVQIAQNILVKALADVEPVKPDVAASVTVGVLVLILALVCRYGAESAAEQTSPKEERFTQNSTGG